MLVKNVLRKIKKSFGRYLSLLFIILIGVGFCVGINLSVPIIKNIQNEFYKDTNLMDLKVQSTLGLVDEDVDVIKSLDGVEDAVGSYSKNVLSAENVIKVHSIEDNINKVLLIDGKIPQNNNECLADSTIYKVGDIIEIKKDNELENFKYKVVGTISSPIYSSNDYGNADIGNGRIYSFIFIPKDNFKMSAYTEIYVTVQKKDKDLSYTDSYIKLVDDVSDEIADISSDRINIRIQELISSYTYVNQLMSESIANDAKWYIFDRNDVVSSYQILESEYNQVTTIATIIPLFFILIVLLMTSNTMTRMIVEERGEMGTMSSLGMSNLRIISSYLIYVLSSTILGTILGYFIGTLVIPPLVYNCFTVTFPDIEFEFNIYVLLLLILISCIIMTFVTVFACKKELKQKTAYLLRPISPKSGKKIFLERVSFIWKRLSFSWKVTIRNISRYRKRVIITLVASTGCTFLIMIGFAIKDSVNCIGDKQYNEIFKYDNLIILHSSISNKNEVLDEVLSDNIEDELLINQSSYKVVDNNNSLNIYLIVPESTDELFYEYFNLRTEYDNEKIELTDNGVVVTPKISKRFNASIGDEIEIESSNGKKYTLKITDIAENYVSNYIYMSSTLYKKIFGEEVKYNAFVSKNLNDKDIVAKNLLSNDQILSVNFSEDLLTQANNSISGLNNIVILLVIISSLLAFTVLYNLTSISISERTREIATLKVLGFKNTETNEYIYRETIITVIIGILLGLLITPLFHSYIINLLETDNAMFLRQIKLTSFIYSSFLTFSFTIIMQIITFFKLKSINMIESLKSVE